MALIERRPATETTRARLPDVRTDGPGCPPASAVRLLLSLRRQAGNSAVASFLGERDAPSTALQRAPHGRQRGRATAAAAAAARAEARYDARRRRHDRNRATPGRPSTTTPACATTAITPADCAADSPAQPNANVAAVRVALGKLDAADRHDIQLNLLHRRILIAHLGGAVLDEVRAALAR